mmetsp:Transcript_15412/g.22303  ORF Transcript_15412/g.22303 Transcript_15412/m.22303 type:complete len:102 (-) Transcript_15412:25-330(-)
MVVRLVTVRTQPTAAFTARSRIDFIITIESQHNNGSRRYPSGIGGYVVNVHSMIFFVGYHDYNNNKKQKQQQRRERKTSDTKEERWANINPPENYAVIVLI